jgi:hypothetical protein
MNGATSLDRQQSNINLANRLQNYRTLELAKIRSAVRENAIAPQCSSFAANETTVWMACSALRICIASQATISPPSSDRLNASAT